VSITYQDWREVPNDMKGAVWGEVKRRFEYPPDQFDEDIALEMRKPASKPSQPSSSPPGGPSDDDNGNNCDDNGGNDNGNAGAPASSGRHSPPPDTSNPSQGGTRVERAMKHHLQVVQREQGNVLPRQRSLQ